MIARVATLALLLAAAWIAGARGALAIDPRLAPALERARERGALVLVQLVAPDRPACVRMVEETLADPRVREELARGWELALVDATRDEDLFVELVGERGLLASVALAASGDALACWRGFADAEAFAGFLARTRAAHAAAAPLSPTEQVPSVALR